MHSYRDENHYKVRIKKALFKNTFKTNHKHISNKAFQSELVTKSPQITTDEKGANTFPFHNLPPELKKNISKVFPVLFSLSLLDKRKVGGNSCYPYNCDQTQNSQVSSSTVLQNWRLCWGIHLKVGLPQGQITFTYFHCLTCFLYIMVLCLGLL